MLQVLSSGSWPFQQGCTFSLPSVLEKCVSRSVLLPLLIRVSNNLVFKCFFFRSFFFSLFSLFFNINKNLTRNIFFESAQKKPTLALFVFNNDVNPGAPYSILPIRTWSKILKETLYDGYNNQMLLLHRFTTFYGTQHSGRKLIWLYHMSKGELVTHCFKNTYTITASTFQVITK